MKLPTDIIARISVVAAISGLQLAAQGHYGVVDLGTLRRTIGNFGA